MADGDYIKIIKCVTDSGVNARSQPSSSSECIGSCSNGQELKVEDQWQGSDYLWYDCYFGDSGGWFAAGPNNAWFEVVEDKGVNSRPDDPKVTSTQEVAPRVMATPQANPLPNAPAETPPAYASLYTGENRDFFADLSQDAEFGPNIGTNFIDSIKSALNLTTPTANFKPTSLNSIIGMPFQFIQNTDPRIDSMGYGRLYAENIVSNMPIATLVAGAPRFLTGDNVNASDRSGLAGMLANAASAPADAIGSAIDELLDGKNARYYSFMTDHTAYMEYVNTLCQLGSQYLGIGDTVYRNNTTYATFDWKTELVESDNASFLQNLYGATQCIHVYYNPQSQLNESSSNSTDQSALAGVMNQASDLSKEADFLFNYRELIQ